MSLEVLTLAFFKLVTLQEIHVRQITPYLIFKVLVWKTNFDQIDYNEVLQSHHARQRGEAQPPTIHDIPPRSPHASKSPARVSLKHLPVIIIMTDMNTAINRKKTNGLMLHMLNCMNVLE